MKSEVELTAYICRERRTADKERQTHPGQMHRPGICDCPCRGPRETAPSLYDKAASKRAKGGR